MAAAAPAAASQPGDVAPASPTRTSPVSSVLEEEQESSLSHSHSHSHSHTASAAAGAATGEQKEKKDGPVVSTVTPHFLHYVFKVVDLKRTLKFYKRVFNLKLLRHEEFDESCPAGCNGPYSGIWSKTMIGTASEASGAFALELTYNYGKAKYYRGEDLRHIAVCFPGAEERARQRKYHIEEDIGPNGEKRVFVHTPDTGYRFLLLPEDTPGPKNEPFRYVSMFVTDLERSKAFYVDFLGMTIVRDCPSAAAPPAAAANGEGQAASHVEHQSVLLTYGPDQTHLELVLQPPGTGYYKEQSRIHRGTAFGRLAFSSGKVYPYYRAALERGFHVHTKPLHLGTPGKNDVEVVILQDPDLAEVCMADASEFQELGTIKEAATIDWDERRRRWEALPNSCAFSYNLRNMFIL